MARSHLHWWRDANLVVRPAWVTAQPKALDCRSLRLHDHRSRVLDRPQQRCVSSGPWVYWVLLQWPPHRRHPSCWSVLCGRLSQWNTFYRRAEWMHLTLCLASYKPVLMVRQVIYLAVYRAGHLIGGALQRNLATSHLIWLSFPQPACLRFVKRVRPSA